MDHGKYDLEIAYRKMADFQIQAKHNKMVEEVKQLNRGQRTGFSGLFKPGKLVAKFFSRLFVNSEPPVSATTKNERPTNF